MNTRDASKTENDPSSYKINLGEGELSGLDKKLLYHLLSTKELERKNKKKADTKIKKNHVNSLILDGVPYNITLSHSLLPKYKAESDEAVYMIFPRKVKGKGNFGEIKKSKLIISLHHDDQSVSIKPSLTKIKIQHSDYDDYIPKEFTYLKTFEPETTYHPIFRNNKLYFISQFHQGITLLQALLENKIQQPILLLKNLATQLQSLHDKGLIHLDLKLDNIIIDPKTHAVMLIDLGCTREIDCMIGPIGNPFYMTPERADGFIRANPEQDIYSFGILAYQILANNVSAIPPHIGAQLAIKEEAYHKGDIINGDLLYLIKVRKELSYQHVSELWKAIKAASNLNPYLRKKFILNDFIASLDQIENSPSTLLDNATYDLHESYTDSERKEYEDIANGRLTFEEMSHISSNHSTDQPSSPPIADVVEEEPEGFDIIKKIINATSYWKEKISSDDHLSNKILDVIAASIKELNDMIYLNDTEEETHWQKFQGLFMQLSTFIESLSAVTGIGQKIEHPEILHLLDMIKSINDSYKNISSLESYYQSMLGNPVDKNEFN